MGTTATARRDLTHLLGDQMVALVRTALLMGVAPVDILSLSSRALAPVVDEAITDGFASAEEGVASLLSERGGCVPVADARGLFRKPKPVNRQAINEAIQAGRLIAYKSGSRGYVLPVWQFREEGGAIPNLELVLHELRKNVPGYSALVPFTFFLQANPLTGNRPPLDALIDGDVESVRVAASAGMA